MLKYFISPLWYVLCTLEYLHTRIFSWLPNYFLLLISSSTPLWLAHFKMIFILLSKMRYISLTEYMAFSYEWIKKCAQLEEIFHRCYLGVVGKHCRCLLDAPILNKMSLQNQNAGARGRVKGNLLSQCHHHFIWWGTCG